MTQQHQPRRQLYYLSVDLESEGDDFDHPITAIGACFGPADGSWGRNVKLFRGDLQPLSGQYADPRCVSEFWEKNPEVWAEIKANAKPAEEVLARFLTWCQQLIALYEDAPDANGTIKLVSDCPDFDLGRLHALTRLQTKTWPGPIRNLGGLKRHGQVDPGERLDALGKWDECEAWIKKELPGVVHDHRPERDSEHSYWQMVYLHRLGQ